jgi:hypothetical protein
VDAPQGKQGIAKFKGRLRNSFILTVNAGSSSLKFALFQADKTPPRQIGGHGKL